MTRLEVEILLRTLYAARLRGDLEGVCGLFADDARFDIISAGKRSPLPISANGGSEVRTLLTLLFRTFRISDQSILAMIVEDMKVAVHWHASVYSRITGQSVATEFIDIVEIHDGQISSYREFFVPR